MSVFRISRYNILRNGKNPNIFANFSDDSSNKDKESSDKKIRSDEKESKAKEENNTKKVTSKRLNDLIAMMSTDSDLSIVQSISKPKNQKERRVPQTVENEQEDSKSDNIAEAAKKVAETLGGDTKKTESELLAILLKSKGDLNLSSVIDGMQIDNTKSIPSQRRSDFVRKSLAQEPRPFFQKSSEQRQTDGYRRPKRDQRDIQQAKISGGSIDLFGGKPLGIFANASDLQESPDILSTWSYLHQRELKMAVTHPPRNYFEKMAIWTDQGKLWKFPIDNEQGMDDEAKNYFTEHVFLDKHLESWCPSKGPIRHFMELVCVGLSKNPYYTVTQKREHIEWFRDYFAEKKELLDSVIVASKTPKELEK